MNSPWMIALGLVCMLAGACSSPRGHTDVVRLGYLQNDLHHLPAFIALEKGFFQEESVNVQVAGIFKAGPEEMSAFGAGALDIGYVGQAPATAAFFNGVADVRFIAQVNLEGSAVVVKKGAPYGNIRDLHGKLIAIPGHATMQDFLLRTALRNAGIAADAVKLIVLKPPEMIQALDLGHIDAFIAWEPYPSQAWRKKVGMPLLYSEQIWKGHPCCVLVASAELCRRAPGVIKKIQRVHQRACAYINSNKADAVKIGAHYTGMEQETVAAAVDHICYTHHLDRDKSSAFVDFLKNLRYIKPAQDEQQLHDIFYER